MVRSIAAVPSDSLHGATREEARSWTAAWTGGQYSVIRFLVGAAIASAMAGSLYQDGTFDWSAAVVVVAAILVAIGSGVGHRTLSALLATFVSMADGGMVHRCLGSAGVQYAALWLSVHVLMPAAPYGSLAAAGRVDPAGNWKMPSWYPVFCIVLFVATRAVVAAYSLYEGEQVLAGIFLFAAVLYLVRPVAVAGWGLSLATGLALAAAGHAAFGAVLLLHAITFQPAWIPPLCRGDDSDRDVVFFDGTCALCHGAVRFLLAEDPSARFRIAPLASEVFRSRTTEFERTRLPDSVLLARGRDILVRSAAVIAMLDALGGIWWVVGAGMRVFPAGLRDAVYDAIASRRYRWFGRRSDACPIAPPDLRRRVEV